MRSGESAFHTIRGFVGVKTVNAAEEINTIGNKQQ